MIFFKASFKLIFVFGDKFSDGRNIAPGVTRILYSKFVAGAADSHLLGYSLLEKIVVNFRDSLLAYFLLAKISTLLKDILLGYSLLA